MSDFDIEGARKTKKRFRVTGTVLGFGLGFFSLLPKGVAAAIFFGVALSLLGLIIAEASRFILKNQRLLPGAEKALLNSQSNQENEGIDKEGQESDAQQTEADTPKSDQQGFGQQLGSLIGLAIIGYFGYGLFTSDVISTYSTVTDNNNEIYLCEQHTLKQCKAEGVKYDCLFTNNAEVAIKPDWTVWHYDEAGILLDTNHIFTGLTVPPGRTIHLDFYANRKAHETVICSMDPNSPIIGRSKWQLVSKSE